MNPNLAANRTVASGRNFLPRDVIALDAIARPAGRSL